MAVPTHAWQKTNQLTPSSNAIVLLHNPEIDHVLKSRGKSACDSALGTAKGHPSRFAMLKASILSTGILEWFTHRMASEDAAEDLCVDINTGKIKVESVKKWYLNSVLQK